MTHMREFGDEMCRRIVAAGIPLWRAFCTTRNAASGDLWRPHTCGGAMQPGAKRLTATHSFQRTDERSPAAPSSAVQNSGIMIRRRLCDDPACPMDYPVLTRI